MSSPTLGRPGGEHRVLEPSGAAPYDATRLDALAELWDGEARLELEALVLTGSAHRRWRSRLTSDPDVLRAAFAETVAERGGVGEEAQDGVLVGRIVARGAAHPQPVQVGERVAVALPAAAVPLFAAPTEPWDGGRAITLRGHAVLPAAATTVPVGDEPPVVAALYAATAGLPTALVPGTRTVVLGAERARGAVALAAAVAQRRHVTAVVRTLPAARLARALGADATAIVDLHDPVAADDHLRELAGRRARPDGVVLADGDGAALAARLAPVIQIAVEEAALGAVTDAVGRHAAALGRSVAIHAGRPVPVERGAALRDLVASSPVLAATLRWRAGAAPLPTAASVIPEEE